MADIFLPLGQVARNYRQMAANSAGDVYVVVENGYIYKRPAAGGDFAPVLNQSGQNASQIKNWRGICCAPNGDVWATENGGDIWKQTAGAGDFASTGQTYRSWWGIWSDSSGNIYAGVFGGTNGYLYRKAVGSSTFSTYDSGSHQWTGGAVLPNGDILANWYGELVVRQTGGSGNFSTIGNAAGNWAQMGVRADGSCFNVTSVSPGGQIWFRPSSGGVFSSMQQTSRDYRGCCVAPDGVYASVYGGDIYRMSPHSVTPTGLVSASYVGSPAIVQDQVIAPTGLVSASFVGSPAVVQNHSIAPTGLVSVSSVGTCSISQDHAIQAIGLVSASTVGSPTIAVDYPISTTGLVSQSSVGTASLLQNHVLTLTGLTSASYVGVPTIVLDKVFDRNAIVNWDMAVTLQAEGFPPVELQAEGFPPVELERTF